MDGAALDAFAADFTDAVSIAEAAALQETDIDAVMPPFASVRPSFVPSLQLGLDGADDDFAADASPRRTPAAATRDIVNNNNINSSRSNSSRRSGRQLSERSPRQALLPLPPPLLLLRRQRRRRCSSAAADAASSLPCSPRCFPAAPSLQPPPPPPPPPPLSRIRALVDRVNAMQRLLDAMERRRRQAWEARQLLVASRNLRRSVDELLKGGQTAPTASVVRPDELPSSRPRCAPALGAPINLSPRDSNYNYSALEVLSRLLKIRRDIVRRSSVSPPQLPLPLPLLLLGGGGVGADIEGGEVCCCRCRRFVGCGGFGVLACR